MEKRVADFFAAYIGSIPESVCDGTIRRLAFSRDKTSIAVEVDFSYIVPFCDIRAFADVLKTNLGLREAYVVPKYPSELFSASAMPDIIEELKRRVPVNGFLDNADFEVSDGELKIDLKNGGEQLLRSAGFEDALSKIIYSHFSVRVTVALSGNLSVDSGEHLPDEEYDKLLDSRHRRRASAASQNTRVRRR